MSLDTSAPIVSPRTAARASARAWKVAEAETGNANANVAAPVKPAAPAEAAIHIPANGTPGRAQ